MMNRREEYLEENEEEREDQYEDYSEDEEPEEEAGEDTTDEESSGETLTLTQEELNQILDRRLARERRTGEKRLKKIFGTSDLEKAGSYYRAGVAVSDASGAPPEEVYRRVRKDSTNQEGSEQTMNNEPDVAERIRRIEDLLQLEREEASRTIQEKEVKQEFGELYDKNRDDIEDYAEEKGLTLVDAAAIVLRPQLRDFYAERSKANQDVKRRRKIDPTDSSPPKGGVNYDSELTNAEKVIARKMGLSLKEYYENK